MFPLLLFSLFAFGARAVKRFGNIKEFVEATHKKRRLESTSASSSFAPALQKETLNTILTDTLLSNKLSAKDVSRIARSAKAGGNFEDGVTSMAKAGNWGKAPKNLARDLLRAALRGVDMPPLFWWKKSPPGTRRRTLKFGQIIPFCSHTKCYLALLLRVIFPNLS